MKSKILFIVPYPIDQVASQRFRFEQYLPVLSRTHQIEIQSFYSKRTFSILYKNGNITGKLLGFLKGYINRLGLLTGLHRFDKIFIHREATPLGPPVIEWLVSRIFKKPIIYDFDDAIWMVDDNASISSLFRRLKNPGKVKHICRWSYRISCGNDFLADYASKFNTGVNVIPTTIDTENYHIPPSRRLDLSNQPLVMGWTGTHSTLPYLNHLITVLSQLRNEFNFVLRVICNQPPDFDLPYLEFVPWTKKTEIKDLNSFDIGLMPLADTTWSKGKCGFKVLQYMALEIPAVASPVGVNCQIIDHGQNGFLCQTDKDWLVHLKMLLNDSELRARLGINGRKTVIRSYSTRAMTHDFLNLFS